MTNLNRPDRRPNRCPTLRMGNRGSAVAFVQNLLRQRRYVLRVDGVFGQRTRNVVLNFQRDNALPQTGNVDGPTWRALGVTCLPSQYFPPVTLPETLPSFPSTPSFPGTPTPSVPSMPGGEHMPETLPSFPSTPSYPGPEDFPVTLPSFPDIPAFSPENEPNLDGFNYTWEEIGDFRYILTTNRSRYPQGEEVHITFRKRNISDDTVVLHYPSEQLFDFYISDSNGNELYRFSDNIVDTSLPQDVVMAPGQAESQSFVWNQVSNAGQWVRPQQLTLWGVNNAIGISIPLPFSIY